MTEQSELDRRKTLRKKVALPIVLITSQYHYIEAHVQDITCYGLKLEFIFKIKHHEELLEKVLSAPDLFLEIGESGTEVFFRGPIIVKWNKQKDDSGVYEVGAKLNLTDLEQITWNKFYNKL